MLLFILFSFAVAYLRSVSVCVYGLEKKIATRILSPNKITHRPHINVCKLVIIVYNARTFVRFAFGFIYKNKLRRRRH